MEEGPDVDFERLMDLTKEALGQKSAVNTAGQESKMADIDFMSGYPTMQLSFILSQMAPLNQIQSESVRKSSDEKREQVEEQFVELHTVRIARIGTSLEDCTVPTFAKRSEIEGDARDLTAYEINIEEGESQWMMVALEKKACYAENADEEEAKFIIEEDETETGFVRLRLRKPEDTKAFKKQLGEKWYISSEELAEEFRKVMLPSKKNADGFYDEESSLDEGKEGSKVKGSSASDVTGADAFKGKAARETGFPDQNQDPVLVYSRTKAAEKAEMPVQALMDIEKQPGESKMLDETSADSQMPDQVEQEPNMPDLLFPKTNSTEIKMPDQTATETKMGDQTATEADMPDQTTTETKIGDQTAIETKAPDKTTTENKVTDQTATETKTDDQTARETMMPDQKATDTMMPDQTATDTMMPDQKATDTMMPDKKTTDTMMPGQKATETMMPDQKATDTMMPDKTATETKTPERTAKETKMPDQTATETMMDDQTTTEADMLDQTTAETKVDDQTVKETKMGDQTATEADMPDQTATETKVPDKSTRETKIPDQAVTDVEVHQKSDADFEMSNQADGDIEMPDEVKSHVKIPDEVESDARRTGEEKSETKMPDEGNSEAKIPGEAKSDTKMPDDTELDAKMPDDTEPDAKMPEDTESDAKMPDETDSDAKMPDQIQSDAEIPDETQSDVEGSDVEMDDGAEGDEEISQKGGDSQDKDGISWEDSSDNTDTESELELSDQDEPDSEPEVGESRENAAASPATSGMRLEEDDVVHIETHVSIAFPCATWPKIASKWRTRKRPSGWPTKEVIESMTSKGCLMIPRSHTGSKQKDIEWQIAMDIGELTNSLNDIQKQCLVLLKILRYHCLDIPKILTAEHMLYLLFWVCEKIPIDEWTPPKLSISFNICLDTLLGYVADGLMPHYFYDECNMLEKIAPDHLDVLAKAISRARHDPARAFFIFSKQFLASFYPVSRGMQEIFAVLEQGKYKATEENCSKMMYQCLKSLMDQLIQDRRYEGVVTVYKELCSSAPASITNTLPYSVEDYLAGKALNAPNHDDSIHTYEFIIKHFWKSHRLHSHYGNLACFYHGKYAEATDEREQKELRQKAYGAFEQALNQQNVTVASKTDFCNFLLHIKDYIRAIDILKQVVDDQGEFMSIGNMYGKLEKKTLPVDLQPWIEQNNELHVNSLNYSQYLLIKCYCETNKQSEGIPILKKMRRTSRTIEEQPRLADQYLCGSHLLLGYAAKGLSKLKLASETFHDLNEKVQASPLARMEYETCNSLMAAVGEADDLSDSEGETGEGTGAQRDDSVEMSTKTDDALGSVLDAVLKNKTQQEVESLRMSAETKLKKKQFPEALGDFEKLCAMTNSIEEANHTPESLISDMMSTVSADLAVEIYKFLIETFPDSTNTSAYYNNMACMYHVMFHEANDESEKEQLRHKTKEAFESARKGKAPSEQLSCDYMSFLYSTAKYEVAIELAESTIKLQIHQSPETWCEHAPVYDRQEITTVDEHIATEIEYADSIQIAPIIYSFYILINCCLKLEKSGEARELVMRMKAACDRFVAADTAPLSMKVSSQLLLGHAAREAKDFSTGEGAFTWVYENDRRREDGQKNYKAEENMQLCQCLAISVLDECDEENETEQARSDEEGETEQARSDEEGETVQEGRDEGDIRIIYY